MKSQLSSWVRQSNSGIRSPELSASFVLTSSKTFFIVLQLFLSVFPLSNSYFLAHSSLQKKYFSPR